MPENYKNPTPLNQMRGKEEVIKDMQEKGYSYEQIMEYLTKKGYDMKGPWKNEGTALDPDTPMGWINQNIVIPSGRAIRGAGNAIENFVNPTSNPFELDRRRRGWSEKSSESPLDRGKGKPKLTSEGRVQLTPQEQADRRSTGGDWRRQWGIPISTRREQVYPSAPSEYEYPEAPVEMGPMPEGYVPEGYAVDEKTGETYLVPENYADFGYDRYTGRYKGVSTPDLRRSQGRDISVDALEYAKEKEAFVPTYYEDVIGYPTIGYGTTVFTGEGNESPVPGDYVDEPTAERKLAQDKAYKRDIIAEKAKKYGYDFNQNQLDALADFGYNVRTRNGRDAFDRLTKDGTRTPEQIRASILKYNRAAGKVNKGLDQRRKDEVKLWDTPVTSPLNRNGKGKGGKVVRAIKDNLIDHYVGGLTDTIRDGAKDEAIAGGATFPVSPGGGRRARPAVSASYNVEIPNETRRQRRERRQIERWEAEKPTAQEEFLALDAQYNNSPMPKRKSPYKKKKNSPFKELPITNMREWLAAREAIKNRTGNWDEANRVLGNNWERFRENVVDYYADRGEAPADSKEYGVSDQEHIDANRRRYNRSNERYERLYDGSNEYFTPSSLADLADADKYPDEQWANSGSSQFAPYRYAPLKGEEEYLQSSYQGMRRPRGAATDEPISPINRKSPFKAGPIKDFRSFRAMQEAARNRYGTNDLGYARSRRPSIADRDAAGATWSADWSRGRVPKGYNSRDFRFGNDNSEAWGVSDAEHRRAYRQLYGEEAPWASSGGSSGGSSGRSSSGRSTESYADRLRRQRSAEVAAEREVIPSSADIARARALTRGNVRRGHHNYSNATGTYEEGYGLNQREAGFRPVFEDAAGGRVSHPTAGTRPVVGRGGSHGGYRDPQLERERAWVDDWFSHPESVKRAEALGISAQELDNYRRRGLAANVIPHNPNPDAAGTYSSIHDPDEGETGEKHAHAIRFNRTPAGYDSLAHEFTHATGLDARQAKAAENILGKPKSGSEYFAQGEEMYGWLQDIRKDMGVEPGQIITKKMLEDFYAKEGDRSDIGVMKREFDLKNVAKAMNTLVDNSAQQRPSDGSAFARKKSPKKGKTKDAEGSFNSILKRKKKK